LQCLLTEAQTLNATMTWMRIPQTMNLPREGDKVNISNASPLWVSAIDLNNVLSDLGGLARPREMHWWTYLRFRRAQRLQSDANGPRAATATWAASSTSSATPFEHKLWQ
jgi:hypothetical protein